MADILGVYKHYEGTDAQCSGVQLHRELTWATDMGSDGQLRYLDCASGVHYIGGSEYFYPTDSYSRGSGVYYSGPSGVNDFIKFGTFAYIQAETPSDSLKISADSGNPLIIEHKTNSIVISGQGVDITSASNDINILSTGGTISVQSDCGSISIKNTVDLINISGLTGVNVISRYGVDITTTEGDIDLYTPDPSSNMNLTSNGHINLLANEMFLEADCGSINLSGIGISSTSWYGTYVRSGTEVLIEASAGSLSLSGSAGVVLNSPMYLPFFRDPGVPATNMAYIWISNGLTTSGDLMLRVNVNGVVKSGVLVDFSAL